MRGSRDPYIHVRRTMAPEYAGLPAAEIEALVERNFGSAVTAEDYENIFGAISQAAQGVGRALGGVAQQAVPVLQSALPGAVQGAAAGSSLGPWGILGGAALGGLTSALQAQGPAGAPAPGPTPVGPTGAPRGGAAAAPGAFAPPTGGPAAQLLALLSSPEFQLALQSLMLGLLGRRSIPVGGNQTPVPVAAFANLVEVLANRAATEHSAAIDGVEAVPRYLMDDNGEFRVDPAVPEERAGVLIGLLNQAAAERVQAEYAEARDDDPTWLQEQDEYDAVDLGAGEAAALFADDETTEADEIEAWDEGEDVYG
jgi:hypothetical protein